MSAKSNANTCLDLVMKLQTLEEADNIERPAKILGVIDELNKGHLQSIQNYAEQSILKPLSDRHDKFIILNHQDGAAVSEPKVLSTLSALAYDKGDTACLEEIADQYQHHGRVGILMNNLGVMFCEKMDYKRSETCLIAAKACFEQHLDHLGSAVGSLNLAFLHKMFGNYKSARSCCDAAAALCDDISMRTTKDVNLPWKVLRRVAGLCREFGNFKQYETVLRIGVLFDISGTNEAPTGILTKQLMTLQLKEQNGDNIETKELEDLACHLFELLDHSSTKYLPKTELLNADLLMIVITVAKMYREVGQLEEACKLLEELKTTYLLVHGGRCSLYGTLLYQIGSFNLGTGKASKAASELKQAEEIFIHFFSKDHHMVASCKNLLVSCALHKGDPREASAYLNDALTLFKKRSDYHPKIAEILLKFALLNVEEGKYEDAKKTMEEALSIVTLACGEISPKMANAYIQAAAILQKDYKFRASAVDKVTRALDIFLQLGLRDNHLDVMTCRNLLGVLQLSLGQSKEAEEQFTKVQQQVPFQDDPCLTPRILTPERSNMVKNDCGASSLMGRRSLCAEVVSLANLVAMKKGEERRNHLNALLGCLRGRETEEPLVWDFAGQTVYYIAHRVWSSDRFVYFILHSASPQDCLQTYHDLNIVNATWKPDSSEEPNVFLLSSSNVHSENPCSIVFWKASKVFEMNELSSLNSAFQESVNMLFLQPKFKTGNLEVQDLYMELMLPHDPRASLCSQIDYLPLLVTQELSDPHQECGGSNYVVHAFFISNAVKPSAHVSYFSYGLSSQCQAVLIFDNLVLCLGQALAKEGIEEISGVPALQNGAFFLFLEPSNSSLSVVVEKESVIVKCRTEEYSESSCICSLVRNALEGTMGSLCCVVEVAFKSSMQLPCDGVGGDSMRELANCSCGSRDFRRESTCSDHSLDPCVQVRIQEPESDYLKGKLSTEVLRNENEEDILFTGHPDTKISTEVCVSFLDCLLSNRHVSPEVQSSGTRAMSLSFDSPCLDDNPQLDSSLLLPGSVSSLNSLPSSLSSVELPDLPNRGNLLRDCSTMSSSLSGESMSTGTRETGQLEDDPGLSEEETQALESEVAFYLNQNYELKQQVTELKEKLKQHEEEKQQLKLELGMKSFLEDKQKRSEKVLQSSRAHVSEQSKCGGASHFRTSMEGNLSVGANRQQGQGFSIQRRILEISNSLSEAELKQLKFLVRPKVNGFRLKKIREGYQLFEELETNGELSCVYVRELLEGIHRLDLVEKLDLPVSDNAERGKRNEEKDDSSTLLDIAKSGQEQDGEVNEDDSESQKCCASDQEQRFTAKTSMGLVCGASNSMVLLSGDNTQGTCHRNADEPQNTSSTPTLEVFPSEDIQLNAPPLQHDNAASYNGSRSGHTAGIMQDGDITLQQNASGASSGGSDYAENHSVTEISKQSNKEWERLGARPKNRSPVKLIPPAHSTVDLLPQEVAGPEANGVANAFLARHSQDMGRFHEGLYQDSAEKVLTNDSKSQGACYDGELLGHSQHANRSEEGLDRDGRRECHSSSSNRSEADVRWWERFGARPKNRTVPMEELPVAESASRIPEQPVEVVHLRQQQMVLPLVTSPGATRHCQRRIDDYESTAQCQDSPVADFTSANGHDTSTGGSDSQDGENLVVPQHSVTLPESTNDCICESLDTTINSRLDARDRISHPRVVRGIARLIDQMQREREEQEMRLRSICPHCGLISLL